MAEESLGACLAAGRRNRFRVLQQGQRIQSICTRFSTGLVVRCHCRLCKCMGGDNGVLDSHTSCPVQNMGHLVHGGSLASLSHVLRYGFRTMRGNTGGVSLDAPHVVVSKAEASTAAAVRYPRIVVPVCLARDGDDNSRWWWWWWW